MGQRPAQLRVRDWSCPILCIRSQSLGQAGFSLQGQGHHDGVQGQEETLARNRGQDEEEI